VFRGELRAWFCELAMAQSILHQDEADYPDTGLDPTELYLDGVSNQWVKWWRRPMHQFVGQVRKHCHECGVPLRGYGELAQSELVSAVEQTSVTHLGVVKPKRPGRLVEVVNTLVQLNVGKLRSSIAYLQNAKV
jgi:hypothetical protein